MITVSVPCSIYQDGRPIEVYVDEFVSYCHLAPLDDVMLMECFWSGLDENIGRLIPNGDMAASPETLHKMAANTEPLHKMAVTPEPPAVIYIKPQSSAIVDATPIFPSIVDVMFEDTKAFQWCLRLASSLADPPLAVCAVGVPRASALAVTEPVPLSSVFPVMAVTILCVLATH